MANQLQTRKKKLDIALTGCPIKMCHTFKLIW